MDVIGITRQLGAALQEDSRYVEFAAASRANDSDASLHEQIGEFNLIRVQINNETAKTLKDEDKLSELNRRLSDVYAKIQENDNMRRFEAAKNELDALVNRISGILAMCVRGEDPNVCEPPSNDCGHGDCGGCAGCGH